MVQSERSLFIGGRDHKRRRDAAAATTDPETRCGGQVRGATVTTVTKMRGATETTSGGETPPQQMILRLNARYEHQDARKTYGRIRENQARAESTVHEAVRGIV